jgi:exopolysaccharide production protein ExoZ
MKDRIHSLDYLRGIMATSIMLYHFGYWSGIKHDANMLLGRLGIYGVSIFYVLSGITLYNVYKDKLTFEKKTIIDFFVKRIFRIFPLLYVANTLTILLNFYKTHRFPNFNLIFLNYTGLFGFISPDKYLSVGAWSIGNELVFYVIFPILILSIRHNKTLWLILSGIGLLLGVYFGYEILVENTPLPEQWGNYVNPFNQFWLFLGGVFMAWSSPFVKSKLSNSIIAIGLILLIIFFVFFPVGSSQIFLVTKLNRVIFVILSVGISIGFFWLDWSFLPSVCTKILSFLGKTSYSIYLLHPITFLVLKSLNLRFFHLPNTLIYLIGISCSLFLANFVYNFIEKPMINWGKRILEQ